MTEEKKSSLGPIKLALAMIIAALVLWRIADYVQRPRATLSVDYGPVAEFQFTDQAGKPFGLSDLKGKTWLADFFFTQCMGPCPLLTTRMAELQKEFSKKKNLVFVSFSVDPDHDTPEALAKYAGTYGADFANWHFLTGPKEKIYRLIRESFHLAVEKKPPEKPSATDILHSLYIVLVDGNGHVNGYFNSTDPEAMAKLRDALARA